MTRYKWYRVGLPSGQAQAVKRLASKILLPQEPWGFLSLGKEGPHQRFRFVVRSVLVAVGFDERGNAVKRPIETINFIDFRLFEHAKAHWLRLEDPPRSHRDLLNALEVVLGMGFFAEPVVFSQKVHSSILRKATDFRMVGFKGLGTSSEARLIARIEVVSKEGVSLERIAFLRDLEYTIDHATYEITYARTKGQITFGSTGLVRIAGQLEPFVLGLIEENLARTKRRAR